LLPQTTVYEYNQVMAQNSSSTSFNDRGLDLTASGDTANRSDRGLRVALYARVSKDDGKMEVENQLHELREFCARSGWTVSNEYIDKMSGGKSDRPQFVKLFEDASKRKFDLVLFWALDRFSREGTLATLQHLQNLSASGVNWRSYQEAYLDSCGPFKDVVVSLMATLAKQERLRISERTKAGLRRARRAGKVLGRPRVDVDRVKLRQLQASGLSLRQIAAKTMVSLSTIVRALGAAQ
jgi:DNA invertase Pin-like site-specific DNA recombinase